MITNMCFAYTFTPPATASLKHATAGAMSNKVEFLPLIQSLTRLLHADTVTNEVPVVVPTSDVGKR